MTQVYYGTKRIAAKPMTRLEYNTFRGWELPSNENGADEGYLVEYLDGGNPNVEGYAGYVSWSPKEQFEAAYKADGALDFAGAFVALRDGKKLARAGWNGKGMFVFLVAGSTFKVNRAPLLGIYPEGTEITYRAHIDIKNVDGSIAVWVPSQTDLQADDWGIVEDAAEEKQAA